jgi:hypothetical protein
LTAFGLNWLWEMLQMAGYAEMAGRAWRATLPSCMLASLGDVLITVAVYGVGALASGQVRWGTTRKWNIYAAAALLGTGCATAIEWHALATGRWSYSRHMPIVPLLAVGLWPLLQLTLLVPVSLWFAAWCCNRR